MGDYKKEVHLVIKSIIYNSEMLIKQAKELEQACQSDCEDYNEVYATMHRLMDHSSNIGTKIGEMSLFL